MRDYPRLTVSQAEAVYQALARSEEPDFAAVPDHDKFLSRYRDVREAVGQLISEFPAESLAKSNPVLANFEARLGIVLHELIPWGDHTGDRDFWRWIALVPVRDAVLYRHQYSVPPNEANYGIGSITENLAFRSWIRADIAYDPDAPKFSEERYAWAMVGDQDLWRSFLIRVRYSYSRELARALLEFQHPDRTTQRTLKAGDKTTGIRLLSKRLTRLHPNLCFAALDRAECLQLIRELSDGLEKGDGGRFSYVGQT